MRKYETIEVSLETYNELLEIEDKYLEIKKLDFDDWFDLNHSYESKDEWNRVWDAARGGL